MKQWILRWLGLVPKMHPGNYATANAPIMSSPHAELIHGLSQRHYFEIINAANGKIVVYNRHTSNPNGPDKNDMDVYIVPEGENLMDTVTTAVVSARLK